MPNLKARCSVPRMSKLMASCGARSASGSELICLRNSAKKKYPSDRHLQTIVKTGALSSRTKALQVIEIFHHHLKETDSDFHGADEIVVFDSVISDIKSFIAMMQFRHESNGISPVFDLAAGSGYTEAAIQGIIDQKLMPRVVCEQVADLVASMCGKRPAVITISDASGGYGLPEITHGRIDVISILGNQKDKLPKIAEPSPKIASD